MLLAMKSWSSKPSGPWRWRICSFPPASVAGQLGVYSLEHRSLFRRIWRLLLSSPWLQFLEQKISTVREEQKHQKCKPTVPAYYAEDSPHRAQGAAAPSLFFHVSRNKYGWMPMSSLLKQLAQAVTSAPGLLLHLVTSGILMSMEVLYAQGFCCEHGVGSNLINKVTNSYLPFLKPGYYFLPSIHK